MRKALFAPLLAFALTAPADAEWRKIGRDSTNSVWYADPQRVKLANGKVQAWIEIDARQDRSVSWSEAKELLSFDCSTDQYKTLSFIKYDSYGKVIRSDSVPDYGSGYDPIVPDTMAETVERQVCPNSSGNQ